MAAVTGERRWGSSRARPESWGRRDRQGDRGGEV